MRYTIQLILTILTISSVSFAQSPEAKALFDRCLDVFTPESSFSANVRLTLLLPEEEPQVFAGEIKTLGQKVRLEMTDWIFIADGKTTWTYLKERNEVQIGDADEYATAFYNPVSFIQDLLEGDFSYDFVFPPKNESQELKYMDFTPANKEIEYFKIRLAIEPATAMVRIIELFEKSGTKTRIELSEVNKSTELKEEEFQFDEKLYPGILIEDLRF